MNETGRPRRHTRSPVRPDARTAVNRARTSIHAVRGPAAVSRTRVDHRLRLAVRVRVDTTADIHVPATARPAGPCPDHRAGVRCLQNLVKATGLPEAFRGVGPTCLPSALFGQPEGQTKSQ
ncbi:alpha-L-rhamnosidase C-terminal domain-containing protein [Streptomyces griseorubiginosus]|uniref:alpha-L-rhamnosidase C-terminal domain-containing protein n=1 Tax=Streptomyces griseorubiginosus TaxID=67304 RepID=UPI002E805416|nr:alpha-L-rhamnosidase C-terminal domain-containing protein [Streptomyces griseorubiginosus]WUB45275.1 hypothetical protein OHN19_18740 [Streptomyces griseorubiginosus]WUB53792.1 hypothetical protein OG942_18735 [Streptomyces griseorubiginosus]